MKTLLFHLWDQDYYVEMDGSTDPPNLMGTFSSLPALNQYMHEKSYHFTGDVNNIEFTEDSFSFDIQRLKNGVVKDRGRVYVTKAWLNEEE